MTLQEQRAGDELTSWMEVTTTTSSTTMGLPKVYFTHLEIILPETFLFYDKPVYRFRGANDRVWDFMRLDYDNVPPMPVTTIVTSPAMVPRDNRWFVRTRHIYTEKIIYEEEFENDPRPQERTVVKVTGWGDVPGFNLTTLNRIALEYPILPNMNNANVQIYFELPFVLVNLATSLIIKGPKGFKIKCPDKSTRPANYGCQPCFDFAMTYVDLMIREAEENRIQGEILGTNPNIVLPDPAVEAFGSQFRDNIKDPVTHECFTPDDMWRNPQHKESFGNEFFYYANVSLPGLILSPKQIGDVRLLKAAVPFSFVLKLDTP
jgi:hypothetical protein